MIKIKNSIIIIFIYLVSCTHTKPTIQITECISDDFEIINYTGYFTDTDRKNLILFTQVCRRTFKACLKKVIKYEENHYAVICS